MTLDEMAGTGLIIDRGAMAKQQNPNAAVSPAKQYSQIIYPISVLISGFTRCNDLDSGVCVLWKEGSRAGGKHLFRADESKHGVRQLIRGEGK
jgi:hypothetical protein